MGLKDSIRDNFKMVAFKTYLETVYPFNEKQREQLNTLLSLDFDELWAGILGQ